MTLTVGDGPSLTLPDPVTLVCAQVLLGAPKRPYPVIGILIYGVWPYLLTLFEPPLLAEPGTVAPSTPQSEEDG